MRYLLDTNIVSDLIRNPQGLVFKHILKVGEGTGLHQHHRRRRVALWSHKEGIATAVGSVRVSTQCP